MVEQRDGWFVVNAKDAQWFRHASFGGRCRFEAGHTFPHTGINLAVLEPGKPNCRYHRENAQEDFLVLSGECLLIANGSERKLRAWDFVHCPPGTSHVFVGQGRGPCVVLMIGHRPAQHELFYPHEPKAASHGAQAPEPTPDPRVAYRDVSRWEPVDGPPAGWV